VLLFESYFTLVSLVALGLGIAVVFTAILRGQTQKSATPETQRGWAWWVEVVTQQPDCTYYFGPFANAQEAEQAQDGYVQDLRQEGPQGITAQVKWCQPQQLTICQAEELEAHPA
jgi:hypothetical protein